MRKWILVTLVLVEIVVLWAAPSTRTSGVATDVALNARTSVVTTDEPQNAMPSFDVNTTEADEAVFDEQRDAPASRYQMRTQVDEIVPDRPLHTTTSYYMNTADQIRLRVLGCEAGAKTIGLSGTADDLIILVFGAPKEQNGLKGTIIFRAPGAPSSGFASVVELQQGAKAFVSSYLSCADPNARLSLVLGTSNWGTQVTREHGIAWAQMVSDVSTWKDAQRVSVFGGNDMEADWGKPEVARAWVDGYLSVAGPGLYNFGDAAGCPWTDKAAPLCNNGWTVEDIWYISAGAGNVQAIPQIYNPTQAKQWYQLKRYSLARSKDDFKPLVIAGVLTMDGDCRQEGGCGPAFNLTPEEGYQHLFDLLNANPETAQKLRYSTDIKKAWLP
ncbi:MAG: hypothetical protein HY675_11460 [Chloroflexi bacterium]|nr:hypothetical protein [Chloroflexota bacterium]